MRQGTQKQAAPQTRAELDAIMLRREELRSQLRSLEERRTQLAAQRQVTGADQRGALDQRIQALDERIPRIEREILQADEVIANAVGRITTTADPTPFPPGLLPSPEQVTVLTEPPSWPVATDVTRIMVFEALGFVVIGLVAWRYMVRRMEQRFMGKGADAGHVARLQQSLDSIAVEVERISENQRYVTRLLADKVPEAGGAPARK